MTQFKFEYKDLRIDQNSKHLTIKNKDVKYVLNHENTEYLLNHENYNFINSTSNTENHLCRLLNVRGCNSFEKVVNFVKDNINYIFSYCTICGKKIPDIGEVSNCSSCFDDSLKIVTDNVVTDLYKKDKLVFNLVILAGYSCLDNPNANTIMAPLPKFFLTVSNLKSKLKFSLESFGSIIKIMNETTNDYDLFFNLGEKDYTFVKFLIKTNNTNLMSNILFDKDDNVCENDNIDNILTCKKIVTFSVIHPIDKEEEFNNIKAYYLFHGSPIGCWHGILKNGIKNLSNTKLMTSGAAHGAGVYLSNNFDISHIYGMDKFSRLETLTVGVIQVKHDIKKYDKGGGIYVVPDDSELLLKYLIVIVKGCKNTKGIKNITSYFTKEKVKEIDNSNSDIPLIKLKRLDVETKKIDKLVKKKGFEVDFTDNIFKIRTPDINFNVKLLNDYPVSPPFIWISKISKKVTSDISVLSNGAIILKEIVPSNWVVSTKLFKLIETILNSVTTEDTTPKTYDYDKAFNEFCRKVK